MQFILHLGNEIDSKHYNLKISSCSSIYRVHKIKNLVICQMIRNVSEICKKYHQEPCLIILFSGYDDEYTFQKIHLL